MTSSPPAAPAAAVTFADLGLPVVLVQALRRNGIDAPFPIQAATAPDVLAGRDVLGRGPTGSGKTLAFGLPMLTVLSGSAARPGRPRGLILVPTRELATQIERALDEPALALGLRVASVVGGAPIKRQADRLARGVDLLIATPGRLEDLIGQRSADLSDVRITALDEADHMADMGFLPQVVKLLDRTPKDGQRLLFSATLDGEVDKLVRRYLRSPVTHSTAPPSASVSTMSHHLLFVRDKADKRAVATEIAARDGLTIMFVRTKHGADRLARQLRGAGVAAGALHGGKAQNNRTRTLAAFADGETPVLVTTDVAARGIHVDGISLVVHVDPPAESKAYLHRAGRTARAGEDGVVVTLVTAEERADVEKMTRKAGVDIAGVNVGPGDRRLSEITGARKPPGGSVAAPAAATEGSARSTRANGAAERSAPGRTGTSAGRAAGTRASHGTDDRTARGTRNGRPAEGRYADAPNEDRPSRGTRGRRPASGAYGEGPASDSRAADRPARGARTGRRADNAYTDGPAADTWASNEFADRPARGARTDRTTEGGSARSGGRSRRANSAQGSPRTTSRDAAPSGRPGRAARPNAAAAPNARPNTAAPKVRADGSPHTGRPVKNTATGRGAAEPAGKNRASNSDTPGNTRRRAGRPQGSPVQGNRRAN